MAQVRFSVNSVIRKDPHPVQCDQDVSRANESRADRTTKSQPTNSVRGRKIPKRRGVLHEAKGKGVRTGISRAAYGFLDPSSAGVMIPPGAAHHRAKGSM
jgi:hypothetical protein